MKWKSICVVVKTLCNAFLFKEAPNQFAPEPALTLRSLRLCETFFRRALIEKKLLAKDAEHAKGRRGFSCFRVAGLPAIWGSPAARIFLALALCSTAHAHVVSMSSGEIHVTGRTATYELRMPAYEITHVANPATELLDQITFAGARRTASECKQEQDTYDCTAAYEFATEVPDKLEVECTLFRVTVPNHIHMLYAVQGENSDQVVFDQSTPRREMRFHPVTFTETITRDGGAGALRFLSSVAGILFIAALALAARSPREAAILGVSFLAAEWLVRPIVPYIRIGLTPDFLEAVLALTVAYLAAEIFFLPAGRARWAVVPLLGFAHGLPFAGFPPLYMAGAGAVQAVLIAALAVPLLRLPAARRGTAAAVLMVVAAGWFTSLLVK